jgi:hypothetical protein
MERFLKEERWFCGFAGVKRWACFDFSDMMQCGESLVKEACGMRRRNTSLAAARNKHKNMS